MITTSPIKWHGGKARLARRIVALMPPHLHYVEPFAGGLNVLLAKDPEGVSEVVNDLDEHLTNFWNVLKFPALYDSFRRVCEATPFSELEWDIAKGESEIRFNDGRTDEPAMVYRAHRFFVLCRQSLAGRMKSFTGVTRTRTRRGMNNEVSAWLSAVEGLPAVHGRLKRVLVLSRDALGVIRGQDGGQTLFYCDPPYLGETRAAPNVYAREMTADQHAELLAALKACRGRVMLSGYRSPLYDDALSGWTRHDFDVANHAAGGAGKRRMTECLWCNF